MNFTQKPCGFLIKQIHDSIEKQANNSLRSLGLTISQVNMLLMINASFEQKMTLKEIERQLHIAQSTAAGIVYRLEQKKLVQSFADNLDKRIKIVAITDSGKQCCRNAENNITETEKKILCALSEDERETFREMLQKVNEKLK